MAKVTAAVPVMAARRGLDRHGLPPALAFGQPPVLAEGQPPVLAEGQPNDLPCPGHPRFDRGARMARTSPAITDRRCRRGRMGMAELPEPMLTAAPVFDTATYSQFDRTLRCGGARGEREQRTRKWGI
jgi:hypothetical protein